MCCNANHVTGTKVTRGFGSNSPPKSSMQQLMVAQETEASSPDMEGPIALIAPELPEDTLLDVRKQACLTLHFSGRDIITCTLLKVKVVHVISI